MNKIKTRHNKERVPLIKETFYNICYLIPVSLFLLVLSLLMNLTIGDNCVIYSNSFISPICNNVFSIEITIRFIYIYIIGIFFYGGVAHLVMNILMVTKRIFKLFDKEIDLMTNAEDESFSPKDISINSVIDDEDIPG